jgi:two-component sensor histidine kinase
VSLPAVLLGAIGIVTWYEAWREAERELLRSSDAVGEYVLRVLDGQQVAADRVNDLLRGMSNQQIKELERPLHQQLAALLPDLPLVETIAVLDAKGLLLLTANVYPVPRDAYFADQEWVRDLKQADAPRTHISKVSVGRLDANLFFGVSRRRVMVGQSGRADDYAGVINISVDPNKLASGFVDLISERGDEVRLVRADGEILSRSPVFAKPLEPLRPATSPWFFKYATAGTWRATYLSTPHPDGTDRLVAIRRISGFPLYATVARERGAIAARWWQGFSVHLGLGVPAIALVAIMAVFASRRAEMADKALSAARFHAVFDASPIGMAVVEADTRQLVAVNGMLTKLAGVTENDLIASGVGLRLLFPAGSMGRVGAEIEAARHQGKSGPIELDLLGAERRRLPVRVSFSALPGEPSRTVMTIEDVSELRETEARRQLMMREVEHRSKNTLAVVQAALRMGASGTNDAQELAKAVEARVAALGRSQSVLTTVGPEGAELRQVIEQEVLPFAPNAVADGSQRFILSGSDTRVTAQAAQALTMAFHELATNAAKYGAFSSAEGIVRISWQIDPQRSMLVFNWSEVNGPEVEERGGRKGFGTRLINTTIEQQLGGKIDWRWSPKGLTVEAGLPLEHVLSGADASGNP